MRLKFHYESRHGANYPDEMVIGSKEARRFLCDLTSIRGPRMLEIAFEDAGMTSVHLRVMTDTLYSSATLLAKYLDEFGTVVEEVLATVHACESGDQVQEGTARTD